jgi:small subunit ribosomal protein S8
MSKPGRRTYVGVKEIPLVVGGRGIVIISTSNGIMSGREARKQGLGGELICKVW